MSYSLPRLLTLTLLVLCALPLGAQEARFRTEFRKLGSPTAAERDAAITNIAAMPEDIGAWARIAFKDAAAPERRGLLEAFELRKDNGLLAAAAEAMSNAGEDQPTTQAVLSYVLALPADKLNVDVASLSPAGQAAWQGLKQSWLRLEIASSLLDALQKPGKFHGQFAGLRQRDNASLDAELVCLVELDSGYLDAIVEGSARRLDAGIDADRMFSNAWRKLNIAQGSFGTGLQMLRTHDTSALDGVGRESVLAAVEVISDLRTAAVRALAASTDPDALRPILRRWHAATEGLELPAELRASVSLEGLRTELELTLARHGDRELLDARLAGLRTVVERFAQAGANINLRIATRADISARNEAAHLLLRSGAPAEAEREWLALARDVQEMERAQRDSQRLAVAAFLGSVYYNLACAQALQLKLTRAGQSLETAVAYGYRDFTWMLEDGDLESLRRTPAFRAWFSRLAPPALVDRLPVLD